jgi:plastocyanin
MRAPWAGLIVGGLLATAGPVAAADHTIVQKDKDFVPHEASIQAGDTLVFVNADTMKHNVHSATAGYVFDLEVQRPGESGRVRITRPGVLDVECHIHPKMRLQVRVQP